MQKVETPVAENKMGVMPVGKLLVTMSLPIMISMLVQALYNIVDSVFVSRLSEDALSAVSLAFPAQNLMIAVAVGTGVGVNALLSRSLGERNRDRAEKTALNGLMLWALSWVLFLIAGLTLVKPFFFAQTENAFISGYGIDYLTVCFVCSFGLFGQIGFERIMQSAGLTFYTMITQITGAVINIILDPIMIFGLLGFPALGVKGAAIATVIGQICAMVLAFFLNKYKNTDVTLRFRGFKPDWAIVRRIYSVGLPSIIMQSIGSVMTFAMNQILLGFTTTAAAVFGVYFKLQSFIFMPVFGLNSGVVPIVAYNFGARRPQRILKTMRISYVLATGLMLAGVLLFQLIPDKLLGFFNASPDMLAIGVPALRTISYHFILAGYCIVTGSIFQALGNGMLSLIVSVARQLVVLLPAAYLLSLSGNLDAVWWAFPIAELMSVVASTLCLRYILKKEVNPLLAAQPEQ